MTVGTVSFEDFLILVAHSDHQGRDFKMLILTQLALKILTYWSGVGSPLKTILSHLPTDLTFWVGRTTELDDYLWGG